MVKFRLTDPSVFIFGPLLHSKGIGAAARIVYYRLQQRVRVHKRARITFDGALRSQTSFEEIIIAYIIQAPSKPRLKVLGAAK